ncbi:MAG: hypothetical protein LBJ08_12145 [Bifidobacteriaceae bacterium]|nr:hypothetical protein [Bifidobacteriaceae bacterium]
MASEPIRSAELVYPPVPDSVLPRYSDDELQALLTKAEVEATADPPPFDEMIAQLRDRFL